MPNPHHLLCPVCRAARAVRRLATRRARQALWGAVPKGLAIFVVLVVVGAIAFWELLRALTRIVRAVYPWATVVVAGCELPRVAQWAWRLLFGGA